MKVTFPWALIFRRAEVEAWDGKPMGRVFQRFDWFRSSFSITTPGGALIADIVGPWFRIFSWRDWVYEVRQNGRVIARIKKVWGGFFREAFSNADNFTIEFEPGLKDGRLRQLLWRPRSRSIWPSSSRKTVARSTAATSSGPAD